MISSCEQGAVPHRASPRDRPIFKDARFEAEFRDLGFVVVDLLTPEQADALRRRLGDYHSARADTRNPPDRIACTSFNPDSRTAASTLVKDMLGARLDELIHGYRTLLGTSMVKYAQAAPTITHSHCPLTADLLDIVLTAWVALEPCSPVNGSITIVPRSHRISWHIEAPLMEPSFNRFVDRIDESYLQEFTLAPGQAVIFDHSIVHGARANQTNRDRYAAVAFLIPEDAVPAVHIKDRADDDVFQVIAASDEFTHVEMSLGQLPDPGTRRVIGTAPDRNCILTESEFAWLLDSGFKIGHDRDPVAICRRTLAAPSASESGWFGAISDKARRLTRRFRT